MEVHKLENKSCKNIPRTFSLTHTQNGPKLIATKNIISEVFSPQSPLTVNTDMANPRKHMPVLHLSSFGPFFIFHIKVYYCTTVKLFMGLGVYILYSSFNKTIVTAPLKNKKKSEVFNQKVYYSLYVIYEVIYVLSVNCILF